METEDSSIKPASNKKQYIDTVNLKVPRKGMEMKTFLKDGMVEDWDIFEKIMDHIYANQIKSDSPMHPVLMSEPAVSSFSFCTNCLSLKSYD